MFEQLRSASSFGSALTLLEHADLPSSDEAIIDEIRAAERAKCLLEARQARLAAAFDRSQRRAQADRGLPADQRGRGIAEQVALARRESPHRGRQHLSLAKILDAGELPHTAAAFDGGHITEFRAMIIARETACLSLEDRLAVDRAIAGDPEALEGYSDRVVLAELHKLVCRLDPASVAARRRRAESERRVTLRPAPDTMAYLTVLLPVAQAVAAYAALKAAADSTIATGDPRGRGQVMADTLVARTTGIRQHSPDGQPVVPVALGVTLSAEALLGGHHDTAHLDGVGPIPAGLARDLVRRALTAGQRTWLKRLFTRPFDGDLVAKDARGRLFPESMGGLLEDRDQFCRTPWCNAPIAHHDHVTGHALTGTTEVDDGQGLCQQCNHAKQAPGWRARPRPDEPGHTVETTTPTGHRYTSTAPPVLRARRGAYVEQWPGHWVLVA
ncbi:HNH endonuclease signature motif containing protein [Nocardioides sp. LS1]|uniref:HNH endonuclease signature motif containing protein n=1 Tax=Nocardioides sp. LS1 TaxID=1027620 RepID=UPI000FF9E24B|nr:HNH endonuclease signature motif containing protein [Nocardioides sp. LS1]GCD91065.1 hypothetical protein NLS1_30710 [Nocardioides sp. LS1]